MQGDINGAIAGTGNNNNNQDFVITLVPTATTSSYSSSSNSSSSASNQREVLSRVPHQQQHQHQHHFNNTTPSSSSSQPRQTFKNTKSSSFQQQQQHQQEQNWLKLSFSYNNSVIIRLWICLFIALFIGSLVFHLLYFKQDLLYISTTGNTATKDLPLVRERQQPEYWTFDPKRVINMQEQDHQTSTSSSSFIKKNNNLNNLNNNNNFNNQQQQPALSHGTKYDTHVFYYIWYRNPKFDGKYEHWNHSILPHWQEAINKQHPQIGSQFNPHEDDEIGANFYPLRGLYSSSSVETMREQFAELRDKAHVFTVAVSWWGISGSDGQKTLTNHLIPSILSVAKEMGMKIVFHLEPYEGRTAQSTRSDIQYLVTEYGSHPALYKMMHKGVLKTMFYIYDSYLIPAAQWSTILNDGAVNSIRGTDFDSVMVGLWVDREHESFFKQAQFDGFYTYFAATGFTYGSTPSNWPAMKQFAEQNNMLFIPSVGPGYVDTRIRPWNHVNQRSRQNGKYYEDMYSMALQNVGGSNANGKSYGKDEHTRRVISITSYNEWHEGTIIEPAAYGKSNKKGDYTYESFGENPYYYLELTAKYVDKFVEQQQ